MMHGTTNIKSRIIWIRYKKRLYETHIAKLSVQMGLEQPIAHLHLTRLRED